MLKKIPLLLILLTFIAGCYSLPQQKTYTDLYSYTRKEVKVKGGFGKKELYIRDFRENDAFDEDIDRLKTAVEEHLALRPTLNEDLKANLRQLKVTPGLKQDEIRLLLGEPDKIKRVKIKPGLVESGEIWVYKTVKKSNFTFIIFPLFFTHESYHLILENGTLSAIERHYLHQTFHSSSFAVFDR